MHSQFYAATITQLSQLFQFKGKCFFISNPKTALVVKLSIILIFERLNLDLLSTIK